MNKNLKKIIAITLAVGIFSAVAPINQINFLTTKVYADDGTNDKTTLDSLKLKTSTGSTIKLYSDSDYNNDSKVDSSDVGAGDTYYAKTSAKTIDFSIEGPSTKYVKVFKGTSSSAKGKSITSDFDLSSGTNTLTVRVYSEKPASDVTYDDNYENEYIIKVKCTADDSSTSSDSSTNYDNIYLDSLSIDDKDISLSKSKTTYTYNVDSDTDQVTIKAQPEDSDYTVLIDDYSVDDNDDYEHDVDLNKGTNKIEIEIDDSDNNRRVYTLIINRGASTATTTATTATDSQPSTATSVSTARPSQWVQVNGGWQYNDALGNPLKNTWFFDRNYGKWYYLGVDGMMAANTIVDGKYKVGPDGAWIA